MNKIITLLALLLFSFSLYGQELSNLRYKSLPVRSDSILLDSLSIIPESITVTDSAEHRLPKSSYRMDCINAVIYLNNSKHHTLSFRYRVFDKKLNQPIQGQKPPLKNQKITQQTGVNQKPVRQSFLNASNINKSGSISRGLNIGTNNDASVNSEMNLQLSGEIAPGINLRAALSDDNIPVQADGTTQHIREFDRVYIEVESPEHKITAGDYFYETNQGKFLTGKRKVQGIRHQFNSSDSSGLISETGLSLSASRGKYNRVKFNGVEGNQGPYRLTGKNNNYFIIILSGSEHIFVDGKLLTRGLDKDYIINYNTAELKFTSNFIITKNSRITAEFEYSDKNYMRLLSGGHTYIDRKKGNFFVNILSENELRNQPISQELTEKQKLILKNSGDDPTLAVIPSETEIDTIDENRVGYIKKDTLVDNIIYKNIFEYEPIQTKAEYYVNFSFAGSNKGNYMREKNTINGKVFRWVAPVKGIPQGNYAPRKQLVSPKKQTMISLGGNYSIGKNMTLKLETAITDSDNNLYSEIDDSDNRGFAMNTGLEAVIDSSSTGILSAKANYLHTDKNLTPFETFRSQEFERDYNITDKLEGKETQHLSWGAGLNGNPKITSNYSGNLIALGNDFRALKNELSFNYTGKKLNSQNVGSMLFAGDSLTISQFLRYSSLLELKTKYTVFGIKEEGEKNIFENTIDRNLQERSYRFNELSVYIRNPEGSKRQYRIEYTNREEFIPEGNQLMFENFAHNFRMQSQVFDSRKQRLKISGNYRIASISDTLENNPSPSGNFAGNINYNLHLFNHAVSMAVFAEHTTGNRMKQDFSYIEVADGQGIYSWKDFNENGLKELDEFVKAQFADEADYIRISLPTDEYIKNYEQKAELSFLLNPHRFNMKDTGLTGIINNFSNRLLFQPSRSIDTQWSPASLSIPDSMLFSQKNNIQNFINYKSDGGKLIVTHRFAQTTNRSVLINGISEMSNQFHRLSLQYNYQNWSLSPLFKTGIKERFTEYPATGNYSIAYHKYSLETRFNNSKSREALFSLSVKNEQNTQADEKLTGYQLKLNVIFKVPGGNNTNAEFQFVQNNFEGRTNSAPAYEMMEGLKPGKNFVWSLTRNTKLSNYLQLSLRYSGRKSENNPFIHTGNVSIRALF